MKNSCYCQVSDPTGGEPITCCFISVEAARVDDSMLVYYLTSEVALEEPEIRSTDLNIPIDNICTNDEVHFRMPGASGDYNDKGAKSDGHDVIPTSSQRGWAQTKLERFDLATHDVDVYGGQDGDGANADQEQESLQADDKSM